MGKLADHTGIQFRMLNKSKGPAVWSPRCQSDRKLYSEAAFALINSIPNLELIEDSVIEILTENNIIRGVKTSSGNEIYCSTLVLSSGTFLNGLIYKF